MVFRGEDNTSATGKLASFLEKRESGEEWQRLFYVACTRAMDSLVLCSPCTLDKEGVPSPKEGSWLDLLGPDFLPAPGGEEDDRPISPENRDDGPGEAPRSRSVPLPSPDELRYERLSATSYALFSWCPAAWRMKFRQGVELTWELPSSEEFGGADLGSLAHWVLARWDFTVPGLDFFLGNSLPSRLPPRLRPSWNDAGERKALRQWLSTTAEGKAGKKLAALAASGSLSREIPFRIALKDGPLLTGAMDALWRDGDRVFIRDYKITAGDDSLDAGEEPSWKFLYDSQLLFYGCAARTLFGGSETDIRLIRLRTGEEGSRWCRRHHGRQWKRTYEIGRPPVSPGAPFRPGPTGARDGASTAWTAPFGERHPERRTWFCCHPERAAKDLVQRPSGIKHRSFGDEDRLRMTASVCHPLSDSEGSGFSFLPASSACVLFLPLIFTVENHIP